MNRPDTFARSLELARLARPRPSAATATHRRPRAFPSRPRRRGRPERKS
jgi:hypothetical protein